MLKNKITIEQLCVACRHVDELMAAGVTENLAIRTLEILTNVYAKLHMGMSPTPEHVRQVTLWSVKAMKVRASTQFERAGDHFRVEHGTPKREFARMTMALYRKRKLDEKSMGRLVKRRWKLAVITLEEDRRLNSIHRSTKMKTAEGRWEAAGIKFPRPRASRRME